MESLAGLVKAAPSQDPRAGRADVIALKALMKSVDAGVNDTPARADRPHPHPAPGPIRLRGNPHPHLNLTG